MGYGEKKTSRKVDPLGVKGQIILWATKLAPPVDIPSEDIFSHLAKVVEGFKRDMFCKVD